MNVFDFVCNVKFFVFIIIFVYIIVDLRCVKCCFVGWYFSNFVINLVVEFVYGFIYINNGLEMKFLLCLWWLIIILWFVLFKIFLFKISFGLCVLIIIMVVLDVIIF